jgi:hypothetical protein
MRTALRLIRAAADQCWVDCEACGGAGHSAAECSGQPAALMDFLRDFRAGGSGTASESEWKPSGEVVLGLHELTLTQAEPAPTGDDPSSDEVLTPHEMEGCELEEPALDSETVNGSSQPSPAWGAASPGPRGHSSRSAWAGSARPAPARPDSGRPDSAWPRPAGWGPHDAWSGARIPKARGSGRRSPTTVAAAVVTVLALLAAGMVYLVRKQSPDHPSAWDPRVASIATFVQNSRGLSWKHPVSVEFLTASEFAVKVDATASGTGAGSQSNQQGLELARSFGLVWGNVEVPTLATTAGALELPAVYEASAKAVYVDGLVLTPFVDAAVAHALTSALEDQYFNLRRITSGSAERRAAGSALIEGAADRVEQAYVKALPVARQRIFQQEYQQEVAAVQRVAAGLPPFVADTAGFPDDFGLALVDGLYAQGGSAEVDEAFRVPPALDGEVVNPANYQPGLPNPKVSTPPVPAGATKILAQGFGEVPLVEMLGYEIGFSAAWRAAAGWTGDQYVAYDFNGRTCAALSVLTDNAADAGALASAGSEWSHHVPGASVIEAGLTVNFRTCDPGPNWRPAVGGDQSYRYMSARAAFISNFISVWHFDADGATCVSDELLARLGPAQLLQDSTLTSTNNPAGQTMMAAIRQAVPQCGITG